MAELQNKQRPQVAASACAFSVFIRPTQRMGSRAFSSSMTPAASIMRNSENGGCSKIIPIQG